jgi:hypothetical protein
MKKIIYFILFAITSSLAITACTEEDVTPSNEETNTGGGTTDPGKF